jgi:hypothetical protein
VCAAHARFSGTPRRALRRHALAVARAIALFIIIIITHDEHIRMLRCPDRSGRVLVAKEKGIFVGI